MNRLSKWLAYRGIESLADLVVVGSIWTMLPILGGIMVYLLAQLAGYVVGCL